MWASQVPGFRPASAGSAAAFDRPPDRGDLKSAREARQPQSASWFCPACDLVAEDFMPTECTYLAAVHDQVQHGSSPTARIVLGSATPLPPATPDLDPGLGIGA